MGRSAGAPVLPAHYEDEDEDLFETSSSISGDSDDEAQLSDGEDAKGQEHQLAQPARRLDSGCLSDLSSMKAQLPIKKGLSNYYDGKSQSFACMSEVRCLEDLRKKERCYKKIKSCKSYVDLDGNQNQDAFHALGLNSKAVAKKPSASTCANLMARSNSNNMLYMPPLIPVNKSGFRQ